MSRLGSIPEFIYCKGISIDDASHTTDDEYFRNCPPDPNDSPQTDSTDVPNRNRLCEDHQQSSSQPQGRLLIELESSPIQSDDCSVSRKRPRSDSDRRDDKRSHQASSSHGRSGQLRHQLEHQHLNEGDAHPRREKRKFESTDQGRCEPPQQRKRLEEAIDTFGRSIRNGNGTDNDNDNDNDDRRGPAGRGYHPHSNANRYLPPKRGNMDLGHSHSSNGSRWERREDFHQPREFIERREFPPSRDSPRGPPARDSHDDSLYRREPFRLEYNGNGHNRDREWHDAKRRRIDGASCYNTRQYQQY